VVLIVKKKKKELWSHGACELTAHDKWGEVSAIFYYRSIIRQEKEGKKN
jgi:hypothetical protein